mgnify:CR=1 FL=1
MDKISVVVPCYNEEEALPVYYKEMCRVMDEMKDVVFELIFVDDGSSDATLGIMKDLNEKDSRCRYLSFSRNFGKEAAIYAGLKASEGDYVALMDVDLQDPPTLLPEMYEILQEDGYDNVATKRVTRTGEPRIRSFLSESFYKFVNAISKTEIVDGARDYRLMKRKMVQAVLERESSAGLDSVQNGCSTIILSALSEKPSGPCGSCLNIRWRELPDFQWHRSHWLR